MIIIWLMENDQPSSVSERFTHSMSVLQQFWLFSSSFMTYFQLLPDMISLLRQSWVTLCIFYIMHLPVRLHHHHPQDQEQSHSTLKSDQASCNTINISLFWMEDCVMNVQMEKIVSVTSLAGNLHYCDKWLEPGQDLQNIGPSNRSRRTQTSTSCKFCPLKGWPLFSQWVGFEWEKTNICENNGGWERKHWCESLQQLVTFQPFPAAMTNILL